MKIFISAGEPSGDLYGSFLANEIRRQSSDIEISGIGGKLMAQVGVKLIKSIEELSIFGFYEGIKAYSRVRKILKEIIIYLKKNPPDILLPIAFSNFNLLLLSYLTNRSFNHLNAKHRLSKAKSTIKPFNPLVIYYAPPQLWAWGRWRSYLLKKAVDKIVCLFPFEEGFYKNLGIDAVYLGNPLLDYVQSSQPKEEFIKTWSLNPDSNILSFMPGSRKDEIHYHLPLMLEIFKALSKDLPNLYGFVIVHENRKYQDLPVIDRLAYVRNQKYDIMKNSDLILLTSGTASLEAMILETPAVSIYTLSPLSYRIAQLTVKLPNFSLPNLIAGQEIMPEFVQPDFDMLYPIIFDLLTNQSKRQEIKGKLIKTKRLLGPTGATRKIAQQLLNWLKG